MMLFAMFILYLSEFLNNYVINIDETRYMYMLLNVARCL